MKVRQAVKKIVALGVGAAMLGATVLGAAAADLKDFPGMFINADTGSFNGLFVVGAAADTVDVIGINSITAAVQAAAVKQTWHATAGGNTVSVEGGIDLDSGTKEIYYGDAINAQTQTITSSDLALLSEDTFRKDDGTTVTYEQTVNSGNATFEFSRSNGNDLDAPALILQGKKLTSSTDQYYYEYRATFDEQIDLTDATDVQGQEIDLFGKTYTIGSQTSASNGLVLLGGAEKTTLNVGESSELQSAGKTNVVEILGVSSNDKGAIKVNGETKEVTEGNTYNIGGVDVYIDTIAQFGQDNTGYITVQLNSEEIYLKDGQRVKMGTDKKSVDGTYVTLGSSVSAFDTLYVRVGADDSKQDFLKTGDSYTDSVFGTVAVDFTSVNIPLDSEARRAIDFERAADDTFAVNLDDKDGNSATIEFVDSTALNLADEDGDAIKLVESAMLAENEYTFLNSGDYQQFIEVTDVSVTGENDSDAEVTFEDKFSGDSYTVTFASTDWNNNNVWGYDYASKSYTIKGQTYTVRLDTADGTNWKVSFQNSEAGVYIYPYMKTVSGTDFKVGFFDQLTLGDTESAVYNFSDNSSVTFVTPYGSFTRAAGAVAATNTSITGATAKFEYTQVENGTLTITPSVSTTEYTVPSFFLVEEENDANSNARETVVVKSAVGGTGNAYVDMDTTAVFSGAVSSKENYWMGDSKQSAYVDEFGTLVTVDTNDDDQDTVAISYPTSQMFAKVFVSPTGAETKEGGSDGYYTTEVVPIPATASVLDTEVTNPTSENLILVGGPCVNTVAATLLKSTADCAAGFSEGKAMIKLFDDSMGMAQGKVALLVAGYNAADTRRATTVLSNYDSYKNELTGQEVEVVGTANTVTSVGVPVADVPETTTTTEPTNTTTN